MALTPGTQLGPYEIISQLGAGGMGEVYRSRDPRLDRVVAIKVLPPSLACDPDHLQRFEQEARVLSTLSHPNLLAIYDVGAQNNIHFLVSEFLEGQTLRERMSNGALPQRKLVEYALQIASGLAAAHDKGIVHRDVKPENIFVTRDDHVKLLDFGLARFAQPSFAGLATESAAVTSPALTAPGTVMGTVGYMSPEQVRGQAVDNRSDIFSFGAILYEMATGKRAFQRESGVETMNAILKEEPPEIDTAQMKVSPGLERIVRHCLEKNPANRFQSARDLAFALGALSGSDSISSATSVSSVHVTPAGQKRSWLPWLAAVIAALATFALGFFLRPQPPAQEQLEFSIPLSEETSHLAISPDGRMLAFVSPDRNSGANMIGVQHTGSLGISILPGTEGASYPFWSPDDAFVAFFADGKLKKIAVSGGLPQVLATATDGRGGSWGRSGVLLYSPQSAGWLWRVNADGGNPAPVTDKIFNVGKEASHRWPLFLPDGNHFLFLIGSFTNQSNDPVSGIYLSSLKDKERKLVLLTHSNPGFANGSLFYLDEKGALRKIPLDASAGVTSGEPQIVADHVGYQPSIYWAAFTVSENGTIVYNSTVGTSLSVLTWYDRAGKELGHVGDPGVLANPTLSPDNSRGTVDIADSKANNVNIWLTDFRNATNSRFTFDIAEDAAGVWSRDGNLIAYRTLQGSYANIYVKQAQGMQPAKSILSVTTGGELMTANDDIVPNSWSLDGTEILCTLQSASGGSRLLLIPAMGGKAVPFLSNGSSDTTIETNGQISPDGKWAAYASHESGDWEIYVTTFPAAAGKWQVSRGGGTEPRWRQDGKEIFYIGAKSTFTAVPVTTEGTFATGNPVSLFQSQLRAMVSSTDLFTYDVTRDGQRFLVNRYAKPDHVNPLIVILNATAESQK
jgi:serine/threonine protein kinase